MAEYDPDYSEEEREEAYHGGGDIPYDVSNFPTAKKPPEKDQPPPPVTPSKRESSAQDLVLRGADEYLNAVRREKLSGRLNTEFDDQYEGSTRGLRARLNQLLRPRVSARLRAEEQAFRTANRIGNAANPGEEWKKFIKDLNNPDRVKAGKEPRVNVRKTELLTKYHEAVKIRQRAVELMSQYDSAEPGTDEGQQEWIDQELNKHFAMLLTIAHHDSQLKIEPVLTTGKEPKKPWAGFSQPTPSIQHGETSQHYWDRIHPSIETKTLTDYKVGFTADQEQPQPEDERRIESGQYQAWLQRRQDREQLGWYFNTSEPLKTVNQEVRIPETTSTATDLYERLAALGLDPNGLKELQREGITIDEKPNGTKDYVDSRGETFTRATTPTRTITINKPATGRIVELVIYSDGFISNGKKIEQPTRQDTPENISVRLSEIVTTPRFTFGTEEADRRTKITINPANISLLTGDATLQPFLVQLAERDSQRVAAEPPPPPSTPPPPVNPPAPSPAEARPTAPPPGETEQEASPEFIAARREAGGIAEDFSDVVKGIIDYCHAKFKPEVRDSVIADLQRLNRNIRGALERIDRVTNYQHLADRVEAIGRQLDLIVNASEVLVPLDNARGLASTIDSARRLAQDCRDLVDKLVSPPAPNIPAEPDPDDTILTQLDPEPGDQDPAEAPEARPEINSYPPRQMFLGDRYWEGIAIGSNLIVYKETHFDGIYFGVNDAPSAIHYGSFQNEKTAIQVASEVSQIPGIENYDPEKLATNTGEAPDDITRQITEIKNRAVATDEVNADSKLPNNPPNGRRMSEYFDQPEATGGNGLDSQTTPPEVERPDTNTEDESSRDKTAEERVEKYSDLGDPEEVKEIIDTFNLLSKYSEDELNSLDLYIYKSETSRSYYDGGLVEDGESPQFIPASPYYYIVWRSLDGERHAFSIFSDGCVEEGQKVDWPTKKGLPQENISLEYKTEYPDGLVVTRVNPPRADFDEDFRLIKSAVSSLRERFDQQNEEPNAES